MPEKRLGLQKIQDQRFARSAGIPTVETLFRGELGDVPRDKFPAVLKPVVSSGSKGAFYIFEDHAFSIAGTRRLNSWQELQHVARQEMGQTAFDGAEWELQVLVTWQGQPAPDLKFYSFYGEIGAVLEVARHPRQQYAYFDGDLNPIDFRSDRESGFDPGAMTSISQGGLSERKLETARKLSLEIPVPFMRIDFLNSEDSLVFCEFSAAPGMSHALLREHDMRLGRMYHEAEIRLTNDFLRGKAFDVFLKHGSFPRVS